MRDLNTSYYLKDLQEIGANSLKIEGRMKDPEYVKIVVSEYRKKMDDPNYDPKSLDTIFHRNYTKGFLFNEDRGFVVDIHKKNNEGALIGTIGDKVGQLTRVNLNRDLKVGDRIRIEGEEDYFFTIDNMFDLKNNEISSSNKPVIPFTLFSREYSAFSAFFNRSGCSKLEKEGCRNASLSCFVVKPRLTRSLAVTSVIPCSLQIA
jgi:hypothetical protein